MTPVFDNDGEIARYIGVRRDITERVEAEKERSARRDLDHHRSGKDHPVISNLITNSCKSSPPSISISVQIGRQGDQVVISVEDEGFGISPKDMAEIYAPFFRSDRKVIRNEVGTGLGLVISKTLVELHGGEIKASSTVDVGTRMQVILPGASDVSTGQRTGSAPVD